MRRRRLAVLIGGLGVVGAVASAAAIAAGDGGFATSQPAMLAPGDRPDVTIVPLMTVGDTLASGYRFEAVPDGIALRARGKGRLDVYVNHETSHDPFPYTPAAPTEGNSQNDFDNAQLSHLVLTRRGITQGKIVIGSEEGWQRFCSNFLATKLEGFDRPILFTNEETPTFFYRAESSWPTVPGDPAAEQAGLVVAYDVRTGKHKAIYGMGRHNHENSVAIPGFDELVVLSGDDTFTSNPAQSQVYAYIAADTNAVWDDEGDLYGFVADDPAINDYYDFPVGTPMSASGTFVKIDKAIAQGDQTALEAESDRLGVFQFVRIEDIAYDKRAGMGNVVYLADSGRGATSAGVGDGGVPNPFTSSNGRVWKLVFDEDDPTRVTSLSILIEGDDAPVKTLTEVHQPDNLETTPRSLLIQEDPGSSQQFAFDSTDPSATAARIWRYALDGGQLEVVAKVDQSADEGPTDVDGDATTLNTPGNLGAWESSGIVDASDFFGPGTFLVTVQAHTLWVEKAPGDDNAAPAGPDFTYKREGGQLVLLRIPGA